MPVSDILLLRFPLAIWVGGTVLIFLAAPVLFSSIPSRDTAGAAFGAILRNFELLKHFLSLLLVAGVFRAVSSAGRIEGRSALAATGIFLAVATNVYLSMVLRPRMAYFRNQAGSFDEAPPDDPWRKKFNRLHRRATAVTTAGLLFAAAALFCTP